MLNQDSLSRARTLSLCLSVSVFVSVSLSVSVSPPLPLSLCRSVTLCLSPSLPRVVQQDSTPSVDHEIAHQHIAPYGCTLSLCLSVSLSLCLSVPLSLEWCNRSPAHCPIWLARPPLGPADPQSIGASRSECTQTPALQSRQSSHS